MSLETVRQDLRFALRSLAKSPGFTAAVVLTLALGLGANSAVFSVVRGVLLTPLPFEAPERLVRVLHGHAERGMEPGIFSPQDLDDLRRLGGDGGVYDRLAAWWFVPGQSGMNLTDPAGDDEPLRVGATFVSDAFFVTLWEIRPDQPISEVRALTGVVREQTARPRLLVSLVGGFAVLAAILAAIGLYGVVAYTVRRRTREIGIRIALGAGRPRVIGGVIARSLLLVGAGLGVGLLAAALGSDLLASQLYEITPSDPASYGAVVLLVAGVGLAAALAPARRASRVDPVEALRSE